MKKYTIKALISVILAIVIECLIAIYPASAYFIGGLASGIVGEISTCVKLFVPIFLFLFWILNMSYTTTFKREKAQRFVVLVIQYFCAGILFILGYNRFLKPYLDRFPDSFENSHFYLKFAMVLAVTALPVTNFNKCKDELKGLVEWFKVIFRKIMWLLNKIVNGLLFVWKKCEMILSRCQKLVIALFTIGLAFVTIETYTTNVFYTIDKTRIFWNLVIYAMIYLLVWGIVRSIKWTSIIYTIFFVLLGITNYYVIIFRGVPVNLGDFTIIQTAVNVAGGFDYSVDKTFFMGTIPAVIYLVLLFRIKNADKLKENKKDSEKGNSDKKAVMKRILLYVIPMILITGGILGMGYAGIKTGFLRERIEAKPWNMLVQSKANGYLLSLVAESGKNLVDPPEGYDLDTLDTVMSDISDSYNSDDLDIDLSLDDAIIGKTVTKKDMSPNIIVVMNESFSDLSVLGELETDEDYMPYVRSMTEDTIYGTLYVSAYGGNTVYSEFEFLTGNTMSLLPSGCVPYTQYISASKETPSIVSILENQDVPYDTVAIHPYDKSGYNRVAVYESYGFNDFITVDDFTDYTIYRKFISDEDDYKKIMETYENKEEGQPLFVFNITMQNHGGYADYPNITLREPIHVTNFEADSGAEEYLSCIKESDTAIQQLIEYFDNVDEPTIILFFGDHQPQMTSEFYDSIYGKDSSELTREEILRKNEVPFFIWSNYQDYGGQYVEHISTNYLSSILLSLAGIELTDYQKALMSIYEEYPVVSLILTIDSDGNVSYMDESKKTSELLQLYDDMQYNLMFDKKRLDEHFYPE